MISEHITTISMYLISLKHTLTQSKRILVAKHLQEVNIMVVQHNMTAINANRYFGMNNTKLSKSLEKLSSGYAINRAGDNAAGLAVSEKMRAQISGINQGVKNAQDGISMVQTFEGALTETDSILQRMRTLATQSANGTYQNDVDREAIQLEFNQLNDELNQIADTDFNGVVVLNGGQMSDGAKADALGNIDYTKQTRSATDLGSSKLFGTVDDSKYNKAAADALWTDTKTSGLTDSIEITFTYKGETEGWVSNKEGVTADKITTGGFTVKGKTAGDIANVVMDNSDHIVGDTITLKFTGGNAKTQAPENFGVTDDTFNDEKAAGQTAPTLDITLADANDIDSSAGKALSSLESGITINGTMNAAGDGLATVGGTGADKNNLNIKIGKLNSVAADTWTEVNAGDDDRLYVKVSAAGEITFASLKDGKTTPADADMVEIGKVTLGTGANADKSAVVNFKVQLDKPKYDGVDNYDVSVVKKTNSVSVSDSNDASTATLTYKNNITLQVGARTKDSVNFTFAYDSNGLGDLKADMDCSARGLATDKLSLETQESANAAIDKIDNALNKVSMVRGTFGAVQNRLEHKIDNLNTTSENLTSAESRIRDTNMAEEMMNFTKNQILAQASQSMLAQANQLPQGVLSLLQ